MGLTFDEAIDEVRSHENTYDETSGTIQTFSVLDMIDELREEYAQTVEMTKTQYAFITSDYERENIVDAVANLSVDNILRENFHASFWYPLTQREVVQAWLHPETIKIVDE